jgi:hypothetical protein
MKKSIILILIFLFLRLFLLFYYTFFIWSKNEKVHYINFNFLFLRLFLLFYYIFFIWSNIKSSLKKTIVTYARFWFFISKVFWFFHYKFQMKKKIYFRSILIITNKFFEKIKIPFKTNPVLNFLGDKAKSSLYNSIQLNISNRSEFFKGGLAFVNSIIYFHESCDFLNIWWSN